MWTMVLLLGLGMAIDPARLGLAVVMLSRRRPMLNLFAFWVGGMVAGVGIALAVLVFMRDVALAAIQGVVSAANEFREAVGILAGGRLRRQLALDAGGFRTDIYQLVDVDFWLRLMLRSAVCFVPHELSVRRHTAATETTRVMATRRNVLDRQRILTWLIVDPLSPNSVRSAAALWWIPAWLAMIVEVAVLGPQRRTHLKALAPAPFREFAHARRQLPMAD